MIQIVTSDSYPPCKKSETFGSVKLALFFLTQFLLNHSNRKIQITVNLI